jgi:RES domain-containing protein
MNTKYSSTPELDKKKLCCNCIGEKYLSGLVSQLGKVRKCSFCNEKTKTFFLDEIADLVASAFVEHFVRTSNEPNYWQYSLLADRESSYEWHREGLPIVDAIAVEANISQIAAEDIQSILRERHADFDLAAMGEETEFADESFYQEKMISDEDWQRQWNVFESMIKTETRFFSRAGAKFLNDVFSDINKKVTRSGRSLIVEAGPANPLSFLYRARVFLSLDTLEAALVKPDIHLGPPQSTISRAGRMNAPGISVFYGATSPSVAIAEVRPPVGSKVAVAKFEIIRPLKLLDLTAIEEIVESGSLFDPEYAKLLAKAKFLGSLNAHITRPVMPNEETIEYVSTQAVADFLASELDIQLDGIIYPSVQSDLDGVNVVLFRKSSAVEKLNFPRNSELKVQMGYFDEEGWVDDFTVHVTSQDTSKNEDVQEAVSSEPMFFGESDSLQMLWGWAPDTLRIILESIEIHTIQSIQVVTYKNTVHWYQTSAVDSEF